MSLPKSSQRLLILSTVHYPLSHRFISWLLSNEGDQGDELDINWYILSLFSASVYDNFTVRITPKKVNPDRTIQASIVGKGAADASHPHYLLVTLFTLITILWWTELIIKTGVSRHQWFFMQWLWAIDKNWGTAYYYHVVDGHTCWLQTPAVWTIYTTQLVSGN